MTWPTTKAGTTNVDEGKDSIRLARPDIKQNIDNTNDIIDTFSITSPSDGDILEYNSSTSKFENVSGVQSSPATFALEFDSEIDYTTSLLDYGGGLTITGSNSTGVSVGNPDSAGQDTITFPAGTYTVKILANKYSGVYGGSNYEDVDFYFRDVSDNSIVFEGRTKQLSFDFRVYDLGDTVTFASETTLKIDYTSDTNNWQHPPIIVTRIA